MNTPAISKKKKTPIWAIIALVILISSALFSFIGSLIMLLSSAISIAMPSPLIGNANIFTTLSITTMLAVFGICSIPGIVFLIQKLSPKFQQKPQDEQDPFDDLPFSRMTLPNIILAVTIVLLTITYLVSTQWEAARWILPFLQVPAVLVPVYWLVQFATRKVYPRSPKRHWIAFGLDLTIQPLLAVSAEVLLFIVMMIPVIIYLAANPDIAEQAFFTLQEFGSMTMSAEEMERTIATWLQNPFAILFIQTFVAVLVPLIEELVKPILIFRWIKRPLTPLDGFWLGLIGGASFSIYETFGNIANMVLVEDWYILLITRLGTSLLHMGTTALMGWALMKTFNDKKWFRFIWAYASVVLMHGAWNFFAILQGLASLPMDTPPNIFALAPISIPMMVLVGTISTVVILFGARIIQKDQPIAPLKSAKKSELA